MITQQIEITNKKGLHARAAAKLVTLTVKFEAQILVAKGDNEVNGKSILGLLMLAAHQGSWITVKAHGKDETEAIDRIKNLIESKFEESE
ncbi:HPr family phosphocarrier protein [Sulfidibacter corallicola]|uniref:HPr family phosphocarrier protein n=1 Tax=Sulfidibacter corallicola TaxID=2818388 RepID=A0A8A4TQ94_SULCO|nr:HPr family phosphocarrier protein [Sulfidibacter corallicola]QTD52139.1 HPr family phosphocarrier protein [Sulfidibacter corallicola]